jgi:hypothetical protein
LAEEGSRVGKRLREDLKMEERLLFYFGVMVVGSVFGLVLNWLTARGERVEVDDEEWDVPG